MSDEWDVLAEEIKNNDKGSESKLYRPSDVRTIAEEVRKWWSGIKDGTIKFIKALPLLIDYLPAYIAGHIIIISGYTSAGKSQLVSQIVAWAAGVENSPVLLISVEDSRMEKLISLVSVLTEKVHRKKMLLGNIEDDKEKIEAAMENISYWPLHIYDDVYTLDEIELLIQKHKPKLLVIDYVQNLVVNKEGIYERMSYVAQRIQKMAVEYNLTIIAASQVSNEGAKNDSEVISLKGAGELAAVAHTVIQLKKGREEKNRHQVKIQIKKNKAFGNCGEVEGEFNEYWTIIQKAGDRWSV